MNKTVFDLSRLFPDFSLIFNNNLSSGGGLSALFVLALVVIAGLFLIYAFAGFFSAIKKIVFYKNLLSNVSPKELAKKQRDLKNVALENKLYGRLWKEFDESLVKSSDGERLFNTLDAAHFFNVSTLAGSLTQNRLLAAVPGFLTAVGVVGTFVGLQLALSQLQLQQNTGVEELRDGIGSLINGASIAFMTSIWGIGTSLIFNFIEKILERLVRERVHKLQNQIDYLFPRINAEQSLVSIADHSKSADETLQGLAEKIGDRLQEVLVETSSSIQTGLENSLNQIMAPAIQSLVDNANQGSEQALDGLLTKFIDGVGEAGNSQRLMMEQASVSVENAVNSMGTQMQGFVGQLQQQQENSKFLIESQNKTISENIENITTASQQALTSTTDNMQNILDNLQIKQQQQMDYMSENIGKTVTGMSVQLRDFINELGEQQKESISLIEIQSDKMVSNFQNITNESQNTLLKTSENVEAVMNGMSQQYQQQYLKQQEVDQQRQQVFEHGVEKSTESQQNILNRVNQLIEMQNTASTSFLSQLRQIPDSFKQVVNENIAASKSIKESSQQMNNASNQLGILSTNVKQAADAMSEPVTQLIETSQQVAEGNKMVFKESQNLVTELGLVNDQFGLVGKTLLQATEHAESGFSALDQHLEAFKEGLKKHINDLEAELSSLLKGYSEQVQLQTIGRLNEWNEQTREYTAAMLSTVEAMSSVVEGMETESSGQVETRTDGVEQNVPVERPILTIREANIMEQPTPENDLINMEGMDTVLAEEMADQGILTVQDLADMEEDDLLECALSRVDETRARQLIWKARDLV